MARLWIVNPFDPLPGDPEQPGRYVSLARMLRDAGHDVTWWTSDFSHRFKRPVDRAAILRAAEAERIDVRFIETPPYSANVSLRRLRSHRAFAHRFAQSARGEADRAPPDLILASNPPPEAAAAAGRIARELRRPFVVDVQDLWVNTFRGLLPGMVRWASPLLLRPWIAASREAYAAADLVVGVAQRYADDPQHFGRADVPRENIPLGIDLAEFDRAAARGRSLLGEKPAGEIWSIYSGSYSGAYDVLTVAHAAVRLVGRHAHCRFILSGRGELEPQVRAIIAQNRRITFLGFAPFDDWAATIRLCDIGFNAVKPDRWVLFPNKIFYYWAAGAAVLNSIAGECAAVVRRDDTGVSYRCGDVDDAVARFEELIADPARLAARRRAARASAERTWDRAVLYDGYVKRINELLEGRRR